jgi:phage regulator Rha-like protein
MSKKGWLLVDSQGLISIDAVELAIIEVRGQRVLLDVDLARMYEVETRSLIQAVQRNPRRFPDDFMFQLSVDEWELHRPVNRRGRGGRRTLPYVFTQEGVAMLSSVLRSERAVYVNVQIMSAFVRMREILLARAELSERLDELEAKYDSRFAVIFKAIRQLTLPLAPPRNPIGFRPPTDPPP